MFVRALGVAIVGTVALSALGCPQLAEDSFVKSDDEPTGTGVAAVCQTECEPGQVCCNKGDGPRCHDSAAGCPCGIGQSPCDEQYFFCCVEANGKQTCRDSANGCSCLNSTECGPQYDVCCFQNDQGICSNTTVGCE